MSEFDQLYAYLDGTVANHTCQFLKLVKSGTERCGEPATSQSERGFWYCEQHAARLDLRHINFTIREVPSVVVFNPSAIKRLTVNGRFKKRG